MEELLDIFDENLEQIGVAPRDEAHRTGLLHQVVHGWIIEKENGQTWLYFQQRSYQKKDFPGLFDLAVGGHVDAGELCSDAILREMREEIGLVLQPEQIICVGQSREDIKIGSFFDREVAQIYLCEVNHPQFHIGEEVEQMVKISREEFEKKELNQAAFVCAVTQTGESIRIPQSQWCWHEGEYEQFILPYLEKGVAEK